MKGKAAHMLIAHIRRDGGTQIREALDEDTVNDYAALYKAAPKDASPLPDVEVFHDGTDHWLVDGFHRVEGALRAGAKRIMASIKPGTREQAILAACAANQKHGLRRTNATKRRAVETLLRLEETKNWGARAIAKHAGVSHNLVAEMRAEMATSRGATTEQSQQVSAGKVSSDDSRGASKDSRKSAEAGGGRAEEADPSLSAVRESETDLSPDGAGDGALASVPEGDGAQPGDPSASRANPPPRKQRLEMDLLGLEIEDEIVLQAWELTESVLSQFDNLLRQAQAVLQSAVGKAGQDSAKLQALRQGAHDLAARARKSVRPHTVCLYCKDPDGSAGRRIGCNGCGGVGYLTEEQMGAVPRELLVRGADAKVMDQNRGGFVARVTPPALPRANGQAKRLHIQDGEGRELVVDRDEETGPAETW